MRPPKGYAAATRNIAQHFGQSKGSIQSRNNRKAQQTTHKVCPTCKGAGKVAC